MGLAVTSDTVMSLFAELKETFVVKLDILSPDSLLLLSVCVAPERKGSAAQLPPLLWDPKTLNKAPKTFEFSFDVL